jgi:hypothetical protein
MALLEINVVLAFLAQIALQAQIWARHVQADPMKRLALRPGRFPCRRSVRRGFLAGESAEKTVAEGVKVCDAHKGAKDQPQCQDQ